MFFNPAQAQSQMNNPLFQQMMQQMQGGGMMQQPQQQQAMDMAPQLPMAQAHAGAAQQGPQPPAQGGAQPGFFGQMLQSPQNMQSGLGSLGQLGSAASAAPGLIGAWGGEAAGPMMSGAAGYGTGTGMLGGAHSLLSMLGLL